MDNKFKLSHKPAVCTKNPIEHLIPIEIRKETLSQIKRETIDQYDFDLMSECPKRISCTGKECLGRPLAWTSPTAKPYLEQLKLTQKIENEELFVITNCSVCPIVKSCTNLCSQVEDYLIRNKIKEPELYLEADLNNVYIPKEEPYNISNFNSKELPWDALNSFREKIVKLYLYEQKDFKHVANICELTTQSAAKYEYYAALTTLSEWAAMRNLLDKNILKINDQTLLYELYINNNSQKIVATWLGVTKQAISNRVTRIIKKYNVKWHIFVKKHNNRVIYNIPQVLK